MRDLSKETEEETGTHGVQLWTSKGMYPVDILPDDAIHGDAMFTELFEAVDYMHARRIALSKYSTGHRILLNEERIDK